MLKQYMMELNKGRGITIKHKVYAPSPREVEEITKAVWGIEYQIVSMWEKIDVPNDGNKARTGNRTDSSNQDSPIMG